MPRYYLPDSTEVEGLREARKLGAVPSVTTIINGCSPHEYKYLDDKRLREVLENEGSYEDKIELLGNKPVFEAGTLVHEANEIYLDTGIRSVLLDCPKSSKELYDSMDGLEVLHIEKFYNWKAGATAGRVDLVALQKLITTVVDIKTVSTVKKKPSKSWLLQLGAYASAIMEDDIPIRAGVILQFSKKDKGCFPLVVGETQLKEAAEAFTHLRESFRYYYGI